MKIAIDVSPLKTEHKYRGIGAYTERLVDALYSIKVPDFSLQLISAKGGSAAGGKEGKIPQDADLAHYPFFDLFFLTLPLKKRKPIIVTIHDVTPLVFPDRFPKGIRGWLKLQIQRLSLRGVSAVITDSKNSKEDIGRHLGVSKEKIFVVPLAPGNEFKLIKSTKILNSIKVKYDLPERFVLYVGDVNWNKNVEGLIRAFKQIHTSEVSPRQKRGPSTSEVVRLVLVGKAFEDKDLKETKLILQLIKELSLIDQTKILGYVPTEDLVAIYNLATVCCQPSFYEGFGLPVLEAMVCGCPVVAANTASLPEVCGKAAVMVNPNKIGEISEGLMRVIRDDGLKRKLIQKGLKQAKKFSWEKAAKQTIDVYQRVVRA